MAETAEELAEFYVFPLAGSDYGLRLASVLEVAEADGLTPVPRARFVRGLVNLRGRVAPLLDLPALLGLNVPEPQGSLPLVVCEEGGYAAALAADGLGSVVRAAPRQLEQGGGFINSIIETDGRTVKIIDLPALFAAAAKGADGP